MTNEYKENILKYITNNVVSTTGVNEPLFNARNNINVDLQDTILDKLQTLEGAVSATLINCVVEETSQLIIYYGTYKLDQNADESYGYIYITDKNLVEIKMFTTFNSGTKIFPIRCLKQDETGQFYGISFDDTHLTNQNNARVILLNNIFAQSASGDYQVILRQSYFIPNRNNYDFSNQALNFEHQTKKLIIKAPEEATYFIKCVEIATGESYLIRFTISVGNENEWVFTNLGIMGNTYDVLVDKEDDVVKYHIYSQYQRGFIEQVVIDDTLRTLKSFSTEYTINQIVAVSTTKIYGIATLSLESTNIVKITNQIEVLYTIADTSDTTMSLITENGIVFACIRTYNGFDPYQVKVGILANDELYLSSASTWTGGFVFFSTISYNLVNIFVDTNNTTTKYILDYNPLNYNGLAYSNCSQTLAVKARLYSSGEMVFARNLYDTTLLGNIATSNLQVPNTLLNGIPIIIESLLGATNGVLINESTPVTKNIYETLYVNFIRSLSVIDEDTDTSYPNTASYINQNINTATTQNCSNTFIGKVQINYTNNTVKQNISWVYNTDHYETSFVIDATTEVPTIDFISNDETTLYLTKQLNVSVGKYYKISQKLRIE